MTSISALFAMSPQRYVGHPLINKTLTHVPECRRLRRDSPGDLRFLDLPLRAVRQEIVRVAGAHDASAGKGQGDTRGVDGYPATPPLLSNVCGGARSARWVEHQVAGVGSHEDAAF